MSYITACMKDQIKYNLIVVLVILAIIVIGMIGGEKGGAMLVWTLPFLIGLLIFARGGRNGNKK